MRNRFRQKRSYLVFHKWSNKAYAVFNSLKSIIKISTLSVAYLLYVNTNDANAQEGDSLSVSRNFEMDEIEVSGDQPAELYSNLSRVVASISKADIERSSAASVNELLEQFANIDVRQRGVNGIQADISIRGGSSDQVLVLLNGFNISDPQTGHHHLNLPIDISSIERIEILKGPGAWKFGPGAFNGAINIITKSNNEGFTANFEYGQHKLNQQKVNSSLKIGETSHSLSISRSESDGYTENTDYLLKNINYQGDYKKDNKHIYLQAGVGDKAFGANSFYTALYPNQYEELETYLMALGAKFEIKKLLVEPRFMFRRNNDKFLLFRDHPSWYSNFHTNDVLNANLMFTFQHERNARSIFGFDARNENIFSNNLGEVTTDVRTSPVADSITLNRFHGRTNYSLFAGHKRYFKKLMLNIGINLTHNTDLDQWFLFPGIDLNYAETEHSSVFASVNKTMRMPTYTDLYYQGPNNVGNPNLLPEEALGYELGYRYKAKALTLQSAAFFIDGENMIDWVRETLDEKWKTVNYTNLETMGLEVTAKLNMKDMPLQKNLIQSFSIAYTYIDQKKAPGDLISNYSLNYLKHRVDFHVDFNLTEKISLRWHLAHQERNGQYEKVVDQQSYGLVDFVPFITNDLHLSWTQKRMQFYFNANNIFNVHYYDIGNVPQPGRWLKVGIKYRIDFP